MGGRAGKSGLSTQVPPNAPNIPNTPMMPPPDEEEEDQQPEPQPEPQQPQKPQTPLGVTPEELQQAYQNGDEDEILRILKEAQNVDVPDYLNTHHFQRFSYGLGMNDKPTVIPDAQFDALVRQQGGKTLYRSVAAGSTKSGVPMSAQDITEQILYGVETYHGTGGYGDGLYFGEDLSDSKGYAYGSNDKAYVKAILNPATTRSISLSRLSRIQSNIQSSKIKQGLRFAQQHASNSWGGGANMSLPQLAVMLGYNVIDVGNGAGYRVVLDRSALIMSDKVTKF